MLVILLILLPILWLMLNEYRCSKKSKKIIHTAGLKALPVVGNVHQVGKTPHDLLQHFFGLFYKYNYRNFRIWTGYYLNIIITDPKDMEFILSSKSLLAKSDIYDMLHPWLGQGLLTAKGLGWHKHRKMITPSFHFQILVEFLDVMNRNSAKFIQKLRDVSKNDNIFDFQEIVKYLTLDIICETAMGVSINSMDNPHTEFAKSLEFMCSNVNLRAYHPLKRNNTLYKFFPEYQKYCKALATLKDFTYDVINKRIEVRQQETDKGVPLTDSHGFSGHKMAFLDNLLSAKIDGVPLTIQEVYEEVSTFIFEGNDTTSSALSFILFLLSRHLDIQQKVYEEQIIITADQNLKGNDTFQQLNEMKYLDLVIKETLRLYPSVPVVGRNIDDECYINDKLIPKDTSLNIFLMALGYNETIFPDPYRFKPERFDPLNDSATHKPFEYIPFSAGLRNCIGQKFALLEIKTVVSQIVRNFEILPAINGLESKDGYVCTRFVPHGQERVKLHKYDPKLETVLTLKSENGIMLRMKERILICVTKNRKPQCGSKKSIKMLLLLLLLLPVLWFIYSERKYSKVRRQISHTKGPKTLPLIGNAHQLAKTPNGVVHFMLDNWYKYDQGNYRIWVGYYLNIVIGDPKDIEFILTSNTLLAKSKLYDILHPWLGDSLLTTKGEKWHKHRKIITPSFHFKILQDFYDVMNNCSTKFIRKLHEVSQDDVILDFQALANRFALDVICETAMGIPINSIDNPDSEFSHAVEFMSSNFNMRALHPLKRKIATYQFFPEYKVYCKSLAILKKFTYGVIEKRIEMLKEEEAQKAKAKPGDEFTQRKMAFLDTLLTTTKDGRPFTRQELYEEVSTFIFEGHDTTASTISFVIFLFSRHLDIQKKAFAEQQHIMGDDMKRNATFQEIQDMKYLDMVIKETLRLFPAAPVVARHTEKEYNINGKIIPEDTSLSIFIMAMGYNEKVFPDPYRFDPERFNPSNAQASHKPFEYVPFSAGPRNCIGQKFALLEVKTAVSKILRNFEILPSLDELVSKDGYVCTYFGPYKHQKPPLHEYDPKLAMMITLKSENGFLLRLKRRL
ncbi:uncharacterized protein LOC142239539 [Haematobia irritans]|uniref:uncharacterized protein LOC142239539 n=1 Tax=Haematobia irritans TaxID=7368 RepID=UPI003F504527